MSQEEQHGRDENEQATGDRFKLLLPKDLIVWCKNILVYDQNEGYVRPKQKRI